MTIVYTSQTGFTKEYATLLGKNSGVPVLSMEEALTSLDSGSPVFYFGWLMAGGIAGISKAKKAFDLKGICGVGVRPDIEHMTAVFQKKFPLPSGSCFYLQGGYAPDRLDGNMKKGLAMVLNLLGKKIKSQKKISGEERHLLEVFDKGGSFVSEENLAPLQVWMKAQGYVA